MIFYIRFYINNYDTIVVEDLNIRNMVKNHSLAKKILDASWGKFIQLLAYKAERDARIVKVNPRGTSKGLTFDNTYRDYIAANRVLSLADRALSACGEKITTHYC